MLWWREWKQNHLPQLATTLESPLNWVFSGQIASFSVCECNARQVSDFWQTSAYSGAFSYIPLSSSADSLQLSRDWCSNSTWFCAPLRLLVCVGIKVEIGSLFLTLKTAVGGEILQALQIMCSFNIDSSMIKLSKLHLHPLHGQKLQNKWVSHPWVETALSAVASKVGNELSNSCRVLPHENKKVYRNIHPKTNAGSVKHTAPVALKKNELLLCLSVCWTCSKHTASVYIQFISTQLTTVWHHECPSCVTTSAYIGHKQVFLKKCQLCKGLPRVESPGESRFSDCSWFNLQH